MKLIILDTNFLLYAAKYKIDIERELERICDFRFKIALPSQVLNELKRFSKEARGKDRENAQVALQLAERFEIQKVQADNADDAVLKLASGNILATMDRELRKRFKKAKEGKLVAIRQKKYLIFT